jgi:hypothetical protein
MSLLGKPFQLEDVTDVERLCRSLLRDISDHLQWWQYDDCLSDLIGRAWEIHERWDRERTPSFRQYLTFRIRSYEIPDLSRRYLGRTKWQWSEGADQYKNDGNRYERERPALLSVNAGERVLGESVAVRSILPAPDTLAHLRARVVRERSSQRTLDKRRLRETLLARTAA